MIAQEPLRDDEIRRYESASRYPTFFAAGNIGGVYLAVGDGVSTILDGIEARRLALDILATVPTDD